MKRALVLMIGVVLTMALVMPSLASARAKVGDPMPEFTITMVDGKVVQSADLAKNKTLVITFIQTACSACKGEILELDKLNKENAGKVHVLPISVDMRAGSEYLDEYKKQNNVDFDFAQDPKFKIPRMFGISFTPASIVIKDGKVETIHKGYDEDIKQELGKLFK